MTGTPVTPHLADSTVVAVDPYTLPSRLAKATTSLLTAGELVKACFVLGKPTDRSGFVSVPSNGELAKGVAMCAFQRTRGAGRSGATVGCGTAGLATDWNPVA